ncbi:MAG: UDP-N-acetylmuramoyl-L-alanine--D-glutamate ligase, partial [Bdellovibrionota bacterium]
MSKFKGKRALVVGFGKTGISVARYLVKQGAKVTVTDTRQKSELTDAVNFCAELKLEYDLGNHSDRVFEAAEMVVVSPGVPPSLPQLTNPRDRKIPITGEIELAASAIKEPIITVTGSNGKTTVTTLIGEMFKADQKSAFVGGNIGKPLLDYVTDGHKADYVVAELSSFQLDQTTRLVPAVAVFTNIEENHLDRYPSMEVYVESKKRLLRACDRNSYVVLNYDNALTRQFAIENVAKLMWFTNQNPMLLGGEFA